MEFFVDPGEEGDRAVSQGVADGLRFSALEEVVAEAFFIEPGGAGDAGLFAASVWGCGVLEGEERVLGEFRGLG